VNASANSSRRAGNLAITGAIGFVAVVASLHFLQSGYDPVNQLMSELALGTHGWAMLLAFVLIAASIACLAIGLTPSGSVWPPAILGIAALGFVGAGVFPLGRASEWHIALIATAFVAITLAMYLLPSAAPDQLGGKAKVASWCLAGGTAFSVLLGHSMLPMGIGQRLAAACVVAWICFVGARLRARLAR